MLAGPWARWQLPYDLQLTGKIPKRELLFIYHSIQYWQEPLNLVQNWNRNTFKILFSFTSSSLELFLHISWFTKAWTSKIQDFQTCIFLSIFGVLNIIIFTSIGPVELSKIWKPCWWKDLWKSLMLKSWHPEILFINVSILIFLFIL